MELEEDALTGATHGEKSPLRLVEHNGYRRHLRRKDSLRKPDRVRSHPLAARGFQHTERKCSARRRFSGCWKPKALDRAVSVNPFDRHRRTSGFEAHQIADLIGLRHQVDCCQC